MAQAAKDNIDVLLVDTAGRMQDNKPLMEALAKLVDLNNPDLCLFVGEALVRVATRGSAVVARRGSLMGSCVLALAIIPKR